MAIYARTVKHLIAQTVTKCRSVDIKAIAIGTNFFIVNTDRLVYKFDVNEIGYIKKQGYPTAVPLVHVSISCSLPGQLNGEYHLTSSDIGRHEDTLSALVVAAHCGLYDQDWIKA